MSQPHAHDPEFARLRRRARTDGLILLAALLAALLLCTVLERA